MARGLETVYVKDMWNTAPKKIYKCIRGTIAVWDLAVHDIDGFAYTPDDTARVELGAWSMCLGLVNFVFAVVRLLRTSSTLRRLRRQVELPACGLETLPCVRLHGLPPAPKHQVVMNREPALVSRPGVHIVWTDGSGRHSSKPHFRRRRVGYHIDTGESVWLALPGLNKESIYRAELLATVRALNECKPKRCVLVAGNLKAGTGIWII
eukprot:3116273-Amphidinium_carterae.2